MSHLRYRLLRKVPGMTSDETRYSALRSNRNAFRGLLLLAAVVLVASALAAMNWGLVFFVPLLILVGAALVGSLWVIGMRGRRR